jgi:hypothetical protein
LFAVHAALRYDWPMAVLQTATAQFGALRIRAPLAHDAVFLALFLLLVVQPF